MYAIKPIRIPRLAFAGLILIASLPAVKAADLNRSAQCSLIPTAQFDDTGTLTTAIGLSAFETGILEWAFFDHNGELLRQDSIEDIEENSLTPFVLSSELPISLANRIGYMLFCLDSNEDESLDENDAPALAANAFLVNLNDQNVAFIPAAPVYSVNLASADPDDWDDNPIASLTVGASSGVESYAQYVIDGNANSGDDTRIYIWTSQEPADRETMEILRGDGDASTSISVQMNNNHINVIDPEQFSGINSFRPDGLIRWKIPLEISSAFIFSIADSSTQGTRQTLLGHVDPFVSKGVPDLATGTWRGRGICFNISPDGLSLSGDGSRCTGGASLDVEFTNPSSGCTVDFQTLSAIPLNSDNSFTFTTGTTSNLRLTTAIFETSNLAAGVAVQNTVQQNCTISWVAGPAED